jgi:hypothetical protein
VVLTGVAEVTAALGFKTGEVTALRRPVADKMLGV